MRITLFCILLCFSWNGIMADTIQTAARIVWIRPKAGMAKEFEEGYRRHLEWHRSNEDPWIWYGWRILTGERIGHFMDGTFGHDPSDFDRAVGPAADAEDNRRNVSPFADFLSHSLVVLRPDLGGTPFLEAGDPSPLVELLHYHVHPGRQMEFEEAARGWSMKGAWYELRNGGEHHLYLLFLPRRSWSEVGSTNIPVPPAELHCLRTELLQYAPDLSYIPDR